MLDRHLYVDMQDQCWIKVWSPSYIRNLKLCRAATYEFLREDGTNNSLHGVELGFFTSGNSAALQDIIYDKGGILRGYKTRHGVMPDDIPAEFTRVNARKMFELGWVMTDYCTMNIVFVDGLISFIDYDTHFTSLADLDVSFETEFGCLRSHIDPLFRSLVLCAVSNKDRLG